MDRQTFLKRTSAVSLVLFTGIKLPTAEAEAPAPLPTETIFVSQPLTNITVEYMKKATHRIPFGPIPPFDPVIGDRWWKLGEFHYEVTEFDGDGWRPVRI